MKRLVQQYVRGNGNKSPLNPEMMGSLTSYYERFLEQLQFSKRNCH